MLTIRCLCAVVLTRSIAKRLSSFSSMWKAFPKHRSPRMSIDNQLNQSLMFFGSVQPFFSSPPPAPTLNPAPTPSQNVLMLASIYRSISLMAESLKAWAMTRRLRACSWRSRQLWVLGAGWTKAS